MSERLHIAATVRDIEDLPALSAVAQKLLVLLRDPNYAAEDVCTAIEYDQALAVRILKLVNSPAYGIARDVKSIGKAVVLLGSDALKNVTMCAGVSTAMEAMGAGLDLHRFWLHAAYVGTAARLLAERTKLADPGEAFLAGLVHDIGELALGVVQPEIWSRVVGLGARDRQANEKLYLGMNHQRAGHILLSAWCLPEDLCTVARDHHTPREMTNTDHPLTLLIALADSMSRLAGAGTDLPVDERFLAKLFRAANLPVEQLADILTVADQRLSSTAAFLGLPETVLAAGYEFRRDPPAQVMVLSRGKRSLTWLQQVCEYHGLEVMSLRAFLEQPDLADLVILDQANLRRTQLEKLAPFLARVSTPITLFGSARDDVVTDIFKRRLPCLDATFTPAELAALMNLQLVTEASTPV